MLKQNLFGAIISMAVLSFVVFIVSFSFLSSPMIGFIIFLLGFIALVPAIIFKIPFNSLWPDILFGLLDNGVLAIFVVLGADLFGVLGAVIGGVVGNAITDGFAGIFEGYTYQRMIRHKIKDKRTALSVALGKLAGCFFGAGAVLIAVWFFQLF